MEPPSEATLTVYGCQGGSGTVELRAGSITGRLLDSITITVRTPTPTPTPVTPSGELSATKTAIGVGETVTVSAVNVVPSDQRVYIVTNGQLDFARPGTCHFEINPRSSGRSAKSWTLEGCSPPGSGSVTLKTSHNGQTLVLDSITIDVSTAPTPTHTPVSGQSTAVPTVPPTVVPTDTPTNTPIPPTPTPTPSGGSQNLSFSSNSVSLMFHADLHMSETLPAAKGADSSTTYSISPAMGNGLTFDPQSLEVAGNPYYAAETVEYTYTATDGTDSVSMQVHVTVFDLLVATKVVKNVGTPQEEKFIQSLSEVHWSVLHSNDVYVFDPVQQRPNSFQFKVGIPGDAGFQANSDTCSWPHTSSKQWSGWIASHVQSFKLVRCALGTGGYFNIDIQVREGGAGGAVHDLPDVLRVLIPQGWHRDDHELRFHHPGTNMFSGWTPNPALLDLSAYEDAAKAWANLVTSVTATSTAAGSGADVMIIGYKASEDRCTNSIACTYAKGTYPHIGDGQQFYIEDPPKWPGKTVRIWTNSYTEWSKDRQRYQYLPAVLMHEFGHAFGVGHSMPGSHIMSGAVKYLVSSYDSAGLRAIYDSHMPH